MMEGAYCLVWYGIVWYNYKGESNTFFKEKDICNAQGACMPIHFWCKTVFLYYGFSNGRSTEKHLFPLFQLTPNTTVGNTL